MRKVAYTLGIKAHTSNLPKFEDFPISDLLEVEDNICNAKIQWAMVQRQYHPEFPKTNEREGLSQKP